MKKILLVITCVIVGLFLLLAGAIVVRVSYNNNHVVLDGSSMEPTLHNGQTLSISRHIAERSLKRNEIIEYSIPKASPQYPKYKDQRLIHRIIGLPGERVTVSNGQVLVFNSQHPAGFDPDSASGRSLQTSGNFDVTLAANNYFTLGDNRPNALDSRALGPIPIDDIIARVKQ